MKLDATAISTWDRPGGDAWQEVSSIQRTGAPPAILKAVAAYEDRFSLRFDTLSFFPKAFLELLHRVLPDPSQSTAFTIASVHDAQIQHHMCRLTDVANSKHTTLEQRSEYLGHLLAVYRRLPNDPLRMVASTSTLCVGIRREGAILARKLGWLPRGRSLLPDAKRIPYEGGLVVGLRGLDCSRRYESCVITDGAIASGATLMSTIHALAGCVSSFHVFSVHSTIQGLAALRQFARSSELNLSVTVGHATDGLNSKYYATLPGEFEDRLAVGDLGDTISDLPR